jgi:hypothetical protein
MVVAKKWVRQLMTIWHRREKRLNKRADIPTSPPPPRKR